MKKVYAMTALLLLMAAIAGCRTKEKVTTERTTLTAHQQATATLMTDKSSDRTEQSEATEQSTSTQRSDSTVERSRERIVLNSCGNVLWHEKELSRDSYRGRKSNTESKESARQETRDTHDGTVRYEDIDSQYYGGTLQETTVTADGGKSGCRRIAFWVAVVTVVMIYNYRHGKGDGKERTDTR